MFTFIASNNNISVFDFTLSVFYNISTLFTFLFNFDSVTSIFVNKLTIDSTTQETRLLNALNANVEIELKQTFNYYTKFRSTKNSSMNLLIDLIALFNYSKS